MREAKLRPTHWLEDHIKVVFRESAQIDWVRAGLNCEIFVNMALHLLVCYKPKFL